MSLRHVTSGEEPWMTAAAGCSTPTPLRRNPGVRPPPGVQDLLRRQDGRWRHAPVRSAARQPERKSMSLIGQAQAKPRSWSAIGLASGWRCCRKRYAARGVRCTIVSDSTCVRHRASNGRSRRPDRAGASSNRLARARLEVPSPAPEYLVVNASDSARSVAEETMAGLSGGSTLAGRPWRRQSSVGEFVPDASTLRSAAADQPHP